MKKLQLIAAPLFPFSSITRRDRFSAWFLISTNDPRFEAAELLP